ncbi:MAG: M48 family metallopeptidase [Gammaproteobacteria bacterium]
MRAAFLCSVFVSLFWHGSATSEPYLCDGELAQARRTVQEIKEKWPLYGRDEVSEYIRLLGLGLSAGSRQSINWTFSIIRDRTAHAFAIGGGYVYLTDGAIHIARQESELAAILAHEMGHQLAGHLCRRNPGVWGRVLGWGASESPGTRTRFHFGPFIQEYDPAKEQEADRMATRLLDSAGFDPAAMLRVIERIDAQRGEGRGSGHRERRAALMRQLASMTPRHYKESERFAAIKRMVAAQW